MNVFKSRKLRRKQRNLHQVPAIECLEDKTLLAGNVMASVQNGNLLITGDSQDNAVGVFVGGVNESGMTEVLVVTEDTTINGGEEEQLFEITGNVAFKLKGGDDLAVVFGDLEGEEVIEFGELPGGLIVETGFGDDEVYLSGVFVNGNTRISTDRGDDIVGLGAFQLEELAPVSLGGQLIIQTGSGMDQVGILQTEVFGRTTINTGADADELIIFQSAFLDNVDIQTAGGNDYVGAGEVYIAGNANLATGSGDDELEVFDVQVDGDADADLGGGDDSAEIDDVEVGGDASINGGAGDDILEYSGLTAGGGLALDFEDIFFGGSSS